MNNLKKILAQPVAIQIEYIMTGLERKGQDVANMNSQAIVLTFYHNFYDIDEKTSMYEYFKKFSSGKIPAYESVTRAIRKARATNPAWKKPEKSKAKQVDKVKKEVGY